MSRKKKHLTVKIKGVDWNIYFQSNAIYVRQHGDDSEAITYPSDREVYFNLRSFDSSYIRHEIIHMYVASCNTESGNLKQDQIEEVIASVYQHHGIEMNNLTVEILDYGIRNFYH